jgi:hypothetical protein
VQVRGWAIHFVGLGLGLQWCCRGIGENVTERVSAVYTARMAVTTGWAVTLFRCIARFSRSRSSSSRGCVLGAFMCVPAARPCKQLQPASGCIYRLLLGILLKLWVLRLPSLLC